MSAGIVIAPHPIGFMVFAEEDGQSAGAVMVIDDEEEARETAAIIAGCFGWPIEDRTAG